MITRKCYPSGVVGPAVDFYGNPEELQSSTLAQAVLESSAVEGDSPVGENVRVSSCWFPSKAGHVEARSNQGGPSPKAKYYLATDSEQVARAKNEKNPCKGSEIGPETVYLQAVGGLCQLRLECLTAYLLHNDPASYRARQG